ncbi:hypothetical protein [Reyranella massiliensis]|uniref:hypothetical protein n=1 Tax=Reyranella massiliensis TaxID=445220 RepID=UPI0005C29C65|nr:hypothetical protein [Reyranella massiliensis]
MTNPDPVFLARRANYGQDYERTIKPTLELYRDQVGFGVEYGKITLSYLFLSNAGGLAGMLAIAPLVRDLNQLWLMQSLWIAIAFGVGILFAAITAGASYANFTANARIYHTMAADKDNWLGAWHFGLHQQTTQDFSRINQDYVRRASEWSIRTTKIAVICGIISGLCSAIGGIALAWSLAQTSIQ